MGFSPRTQRILAVFVLIPLIYCSIIFGSRSLALPSIFTLPTQESEGIKNNGLSISSFADTISALYRPIKLPLNAKCYLGLKESYKVGNRHWTHPLRNELLVIDIDTRYPNAENGIFDSQKASWEAVEAQGSNLLTVSHVNHFIYSQIHGYDYKFFHAQKIKGHWDTWVKPHVLRQMLRYYKFVVFFDADAIVQHLEVPLEFLFNRWNVSANTSIAMPIDTQQVVNGTDHLSVDSRGKVVLNTGVIILQNLPHTFEMLQAWAECTTEKRYPECGQWKDRWSHEQRAFSEFIRYDFNPDGNNIIEIPCNDANGYPGLVGQEWVVDDCKGEFVRHYTVHKSLAKTSTANAFMQNVVGLLQNQFAVDRKNMVIEEGGS